MKIVIIGGGIAGLAFSIIMKNKGHEVVINERHDEIPLGAHAFMMHEDGIDILKNILGEEAKIPGNTIDTFTLRDTKNNDITHTSMDHWQCMKRSDLVIELINHIEKSSIKYQRDFSHFIYNNNKAEAAVFQNGDIEYGDMFIGADGANSQVRKLLFGETQFSKIEVQEILGVVNDPELVQQLKGRFTKFQDQKKGISFGCIPFSNNELIWFNQFDVRLSENPLITKDDLKSFTKNVLKDFPSLVHSVLKKTDFSQSYLWNTRDFDPLNSFHQQNVVLIGDAAHLALPFTSAGTTNAVLDSIELANQIEQNNTIEKAFESFYTCRIESLKEHLEFGRKLKQQFLFPNSNEKNIEIPLIKKTKVVEHLHQNSKKIEIIYFTDPICSTCWSIQPQLRKLKSNYHQDLNFQYVMGGLLPSWNNFNRGGISKPIDVIEHWNDVSRETGIPINPTVWKTDPILSSYPPSIAFKAAQLQDPEKAVIFLHILNELVFIHGKNITKTKVINNAAILSGLDVIIMEKDMEERAPSLFYKDLEFTEEMKITSLPTFIFKVEGEHQAALFGFQTYENLEKIVQKNLNKKGRNDIQQSQGPIINLYSMKKEPYKKLDSATIISGKNKSYLSKAI